MSDEEKASAVDGEEKVDSEKETAEESIKENVESNLSEDAAATKLQASFRGHLVRKQATKGESANDVVASEEVAQKSAAEGAVAKESEASEGEEIIEKGGEAADIEVKNEEKVEVVTDSISTDVGPSNQKVVEVDRGGEQQKEEELEGSAEISEERGGEVGDVALTGLDKESPLDSSKIRLNLYINPDDFQYSVDADPSDSVLEVKKRIFNEIKAPIETQSLRLGDGQDISMSSEKGDGVLLSEVGFEAGKEYEMELFIKFDTNGDGEKAPYPGLPDRFEVKVDLGHGDVKLVEVQIEKDIMGKPFLGGYRNKKSGLEYHHAGAQTMPGRSKHEGAPSKYHRDTQTYDVTTLSAQTMRESGAQTKRPGIQIAEDDDVVVEPREYFSSEQLLDVQQAMALKIQCQVRRHFADRKAKDLRRRKGEKETVQLEAEMAERRKAEEHRKKEIQRRMHPQSIEDFDILYQELEAWHRQETIKIEQSDLSDEERQTALYQLLIKETKLLQTIDRLKIVANKENRDSHIKKVLSMMAKPKDWSTGDGEGVKVHTPFSTRAKELMELYNGLRLPLLTIDERLDVLLHVKWTVKEFDCNLTREIVELIDREADMLNRGRSEKSLEGLRKRLNNLFFQFIETPEFNPEANRFQRVPRQYLNKTNVKPLNDRIRKR
mmetsp:Transcript_24030/g.60862  ORF Transcript_24030/g.60862 Transcript_24030/m.60862 type:complete len:664 (-) Transcript_24030:1131-3122(-)